MLPMKNSAHTATETPPSATAGSTSSPTLTFSPEQFAELVQRLQHVVRPRLLTAEQAAARLNISERFFHELRSEPWMPAPIELGPRLLRWDEQQIDTAIANLPRKRSATEPVQLAKARAAKAGTTEVR